MSHLERDIEKWLAHQLRRLGFVSIKLSMRAAHGSAGWPDRLVLVPRHRTAGIPHTYFVELKTETGRLTSRQRQRIEVLRHCGYQVEVLHGMDEARDWVTWLEDIYGAS